MEMLSQAFTRRSSQESHPLPACWLLGILGGLMPAVFIVDAPLLSVVGAAVGTVVGLIVAYK